MSKHSELIYLKKRKLLIMHILNFIRKKFRFRTNLSNYIIFNMN